MSLKNTTQKFGSVSKFFHWTIFLCVSAQIYFVWVFKDMYWHKAIGATVLLLAIFWLIWRMFNVVPTPKPGPNNWQYYAAKIAHNLLFACIILLPISGIIMGMAFNRSFDWFGIYTITPFSFIPQNETFGGYFSLAHTIIGYSLVALVSVHILGALKHHFFDKDDVLKRMLPFQ
ncbi:MAG: cytochrome b [Legionellales bacterium]|jgi:cytochrome b561